jgi:hypothetical protein
MTWPRHDEDFLLTNDASDSMTNDKFDSLFDKSNDDINNTDNTEIQPNKSDGDTDNERWLSDNGG